MVKGDLDHYPEQAFLNVGGAADVEKKAAEIGEELMATLTVEIVTPEAPLWIGAGPARSWRVRPRATSRSLPQHTATVGDVVSSIVRVQTTDEGELAFAVHSGFFQVGPGLDDDETLATVLAGVAERTTEIDVPRAQAAKEAAEAKLASLTKGDSADEEEQLIAYAALERAELRLRAADYK